MAKGQKIVVQTPARGVYKEGTVSGTPKPGLAGQVVSGTAPVNGRHTWQEANAGKDGAPILIAIFTEDTLQGFPVSQAYVSGTRGFLYCPMAGDEMNIRFGEGGGTANWPTIGEKLIMDSDSGFFIAYAGTTSFVEMPFISMEALSGVADSTLIWAMYTGH